MLESAPLPRFELDQDPDDGGETWDPQDAAATVERPPVSRAHARRALLGSTLPKPRASGPVLEHEPAQEHEEEVAPEDILIEEYAKPQPPPASAVVRRAEPTPRPGPKPLDVARIDALLRSELPSAPPPAPPPLFSPVFSTSASSLAPVALSHEREAAPLPAPLVVHVPLRQGSGWGRAAMIAIFAAGLAVGITFTWMAPAGSFARARAFGSSIVAKVKPATSAPAAPLAPTPPPALVPAAPVAVGIAVPKTVSVDALPKVEIEPGKTLVTFPPSSEGHRVFVDSQALPTGNAPAKLKCGKHNIRIGSGGKVRKVDLPCGQTYELL